MMWTNVEEPRRSKIKIGLCTICGKPCDRIGTITSTGHFKEWCCPDTKEQLQMKFLRYCRRCSW